MNTVTLSNNIDSASAVMLACLGKMRFRLDCKRGDKWGYVVDASGKIIGDASRNYSNGYAIHTAPYAGYVNDNEIEFIG